MTGIGGLQLNRYDTDSGRYYGDADGSWRYPSVTEILKVIAKPALIHWVAKVERDDVINAATRLYVDLPNEGPKMTSEVYSASLASRLSHEKAHVKKLDKAGQIGTATHAKIEWRLRRQLGQDPGPEPDLPLEAAQAYAAFERWNDDAKLEPREIEKTVWSRQHLYAGTMDVLGTVQKDGRPVMVVLDWKTGKAIYDEAKLQTSAYCRALQELGIAGMDLHALIVRLPKTVRDPEPEFAFVTPEEQAHHMTAFLAARALWGWQNGERP